MTHVTAVTASPGIGTFGAGAVITFTIAMSAIVAVSGGVPTLTLNDGGVAGYVSGSGTRTLVFTTTVGAGQSTGDLAVTAFALNGATIQDLGGHAADLTGAVANPAGTLSISAPAVTATVTGIAAAPSAIGALGVGQTVRFSVTVSQPAVVSGAPTLSLSDGGTATYTAAGSTATSLLFDYTVVAGQNTADLQVTGMVLNGGAVAIPAALVLGAATTYAAGSGPSAVRAADLNGDGKLDLVVADSSGTVAVLLGAGSGGFGAAATYSAVSGLYSVMTGDVNGDGTLDLVAADQSGFIAVLLGNGSGGFGAVHTYATGPITNSVAVADVDGDGKLDVVAADFGGGVAGRWQRRVRGRHDLCRGV